jgi:hypothetical protein
MNSNESILLKVFGDSRYRLSQAMRAGEGPHGDIIATRLHSYDIRQVNENDFPPRRYSDSTLRRFLRVVR